MTPNPIIPYCNGNHMLDDTLNQEWEDIMRQEEYESKGYEEEEEEER